MAPSGRPNRKATSAAPASDAPPKKRTRGGEKAGSSAAVVTESRTTVNAAKKTPATSRPRRARKVVSPTDIDYLQFPGREALAVGSQRQLGNGKPKGRG